MIKPVANSLQAKNDCLAPSDLVDPNPHIVYISGAGVEPW